MAEMTVTGSGLPNTPGQLAIENLEYLVEKVLDPAREATGVPIEVTSGYRSAAVNAAIGGVSNSQHVTGQAADITTADMAKLFAWLRAHATFDQLIWEFGSTAQPGWIHVSIKRLGGNRMQVLRAIKAGGKAKYLPL